MTQKLRLIRYVLLLQEFQLKIKDKSEVENLAADHLHMLENAESGNPFSHCFLYGTLYFVTNRLAWYADIVNYLVIEPFPKDLSGAPKDKIRAQSKYYV